MLRMSTQDCKNRGHGSSWARFKDKGSCAIGGTVLGQVISYDAEGILLNSLYVNTPSFLLDHKLGGHQILC